MNQSDLMASISSIYYNSEMISATQMKETEYSNIINIVEDLCRSMEIIDGLKFVDTSIKDEVDVFRRKRKLDINDNRVYEVKCNFTYQKDEESEIENHNFKVMIPVLINENYFHINGTRYSSMFQFNNYKPIHGENASGNKTVMIKTLINGFNLELKTNTKRVSQSTITIFTKKVNLALAIIALNEFSLGYALDAIFGENGWNFDEFNPDTFDKKTMISLGDKVIKVTVDDVEQYDAFISSFNVLKLSHNRIVNDENYLVRKLGSYFSTNTNSYLEKGWIVTRTMLRSLDSITAKLLDVSSMSELIIREVIYSYNDLRVNPNDVVERKLKFSESLLFPLFKRVSDNVYIYLNSRRKNINNVFKISSDIITQYATTSEVLQYDDKPSMFDAIQRFKVSLAPIGAGKQISNKLRKTETSYIGFLDVFSSPNGKSTGLSTYIGTLDGGYIVKDDGTILEKGEFCED